MKTDWKTRVDWPVTLFLLLTPLAALILVPLYAVMVEVSWGLIVFTLLFSLATNLSITAGYHRCFAHKSYESSVLLKILYLLVGASAFQGSAFKWCVDHRRHHRFVDRDEDPYSIQKGFWYAHMGWLFLKPEDEKLHAQDLELDPWIQWQHRYFVPLAIIMGFGFPTLVGLWMGSPWGGLVIGGALRIVLTQQSTFFVNSVCHTFGTRNYSLDISARDSFWVAILTHGEGYHNYHHRFQLDYRNGIRWYHWDPTKWTIFTFSLLGMAQKLKRVSHQEILKARIQVEEIKLKSRGFSEAQISSLKQQIFEAQLRVKKLKEDYHLFRKNLEGSSRQKISELRWEMKRARFEARQSLKAWSQLLDEVPR